ncbi:MAG: 3-deoxy-manno-octulosonate cytidylyltransferase [Burkholderiaceae bacterium]|jgi:3-deoxy-manno-octulosonate cytidylyltransferase (CMP-KDO synthetase)|nr:3-deoxy-manno-octulosonate cytidylyltransferase [Burkholderiaceae bacterium]
MSFHVIIPARLASTRLPDKPLLDLGGKPMIVRVAERAGLSGAKQVVVATDAQAVLSVCQQHGVSALMTRADHLSGTDRVAEAAASLSLSAHDVVVNVQGDEPLIAPALIAAVASRIREDAPMATAAHPVYTATDIFDPNVVKVVLNKEGRALYFSRAPIPWDRAHFAQSSVSPTYAALRHIGLYAFRNDFLQRYAALPQPRMEQDEVLEQLRVLWHGYAIAVHVTRTTPFAGVDTPEDLVRVRQHFAQNAGDSGSG